MKNRLFGCLILFALAVILPLTASAQLNQTGTLAGTVSDTQALPLPGVSVTIKSPAIILPQMATVANEQGLYRFLSLPPGVYEITFTLDGMNTLVRKDVRISVGQTTTIDAALEQKTLSESISRGRPGADHRPEVDDGLDQPGPGLPGVRPCDPEPGRLLQHGAGRRRRAEQHQRLDVLGQRERRPGQHLQPRRREHDRPPTSAPSRSSSASTSSKRSPSSRAACRPNTATPPAPPSTSSPGPAGTGCPARPAFITTTSICSRTTPPGRRSRARPAATGTSSSRRSPWAARSSRTSLWFFGSLSLQHAVAPTWPDSRMTRRPRSRPSRPVRSPSSN
ncbi:MAG: carboxypeptidase-like regulatory domain-containing protein [Comamonadaceae bacterium]|nr:carboxypeptidase-like regulatory domain-containing protein [Comamonadaceae bacterium]